MWNFLYCRDLTLSLCCSVADENLDIVTCPFLKTTHPQYQSHHKTNHRLTYCMKKTHNPFSPMSYCKFTVCLASSPEHFLQKKAKKGTNILGMFPQAQLQEFKEVWIYHSRWILIAVAVNAATDVLQPIRHRDFGSIYLYAQSWFGLYIPGETYFCHWCRQESFIYYDPAHLSSNPCSFDDSFLPCCLTSLNAFQRVNRRSKKTADTASTEEKEPRRAQRTTSNVFAVFNQSQIQEFKEV